jgi:hypothetical protein
MGAAEEALSMIPRGQHIVAALPDSVLGRVAQQSLRCVVPCHHMVGLIDRERRHGKVAHIDSMDVLPLRLRTLYRHAPSITLRQQE